MQASGLWTPETFADPHVVSYGPARGRARERSPRSWALCVKRRIPSISLHFSG